MQHLKRLYTLAAVTLWVAAASLTPPHDVPAWMLLTQSTAAFGAMTPSELYQRLERLTQALQALPGQTPAMDLACAFLRRALAQLVTDTINKQPDRPIADLALELSPVFANVKKMLVGQPILLTALNETAHELDHLLLHHFLMQEVTAHVHETAQLAAQQPQAQAAALDCKEAACSAIRHKHQETLAALLAAQHKVASATLHQSIYQSLHERAGTLAGK